MRFDNSGQPYFSTSCVSIISRVIPCNGLLICGFGSKINFQISGLKGWKTHRCNHHCIGILYIYRKDEWSILQTGLPSTPYNRWMTVFDLSI